MSLALQDLLDNCRLISNTDCKKGDHFVTTNFVSRNNQQPASFVDVCLYVSAWHLSAIQEQVCKLLVEI